MAKNAIVIEGVSAGNEPVRQPNPDPVSKTADEILRLEQDDRSRSEQLADAISVFTGSMFFVWLHVVFFAAWIAVNLSALAFDPYPFNLLTMIVSLEAIFLSTFVLMTQNRQAKQDQRRAKIDLQVDIIAEQEITKIVQLVTEIHQRLGISHEKDPELQYMKTATSIEKLARTAERDAAKTRIITDLSESEK